jgi:hypothetical protein
MDLKENRMRGANWIQLALVVSYEDDSGPSISIKGELFNLLSDY